MNLFAPYSVLVLPGRDGSGPEHWQTFWEAAFPEFTRVQQVDWIHPEYVAWSSTLTEAVMSAERPVLLIAHSAGTSLTMKWSSERPDLARRVAGAFLVAQSDRDVLEGTADNPIKGFGPMLLKPLPFKSMVIASRNDDLVAFERARTFASAWQATFVDAGVHGHLGSAAKLGIWPRGLVALGKLIESIERH